VAWAKPTVRKALTVATHFRFYYLEDPSVLTMDPPG
jgi:hypothetical protein